MCVCMSAFVHVSVCVDMFVIHFCLRILFASFFSSSRELGRKDPRDLSLDASGTRSFATFLVELSQYVPAAILPSISVLLPHLGGEVNIASSSITIWPFLLSPLTLRLSLPPSLSPSLSLSAVLHNA